MQQITLNLISELDTKNFANKLGLNCINNLKKLIIYLYGDLGAGKTTFAKYFIHSLGWHGHVKSPTYTLIENYEIRDINIYHLDLYRLADSEEVNFLGLEELYCHDRTIMLIEWPQKAASALPEPDITLKFNYIEEHRTVEITIFDNQNTAAIKL